MEDHAVELAYRIVAEVYPQAKMDQYDPGGGPESRHDFNIVVEGQRVVAMEVTQSTLEPLLQARAQVNQQFLKSIDAPDLRWSWYVYPVVGCDAKFLRDHVVVALTRLESELDPGRLTPPPSFDFRSDGAGSPAARNLWERFKVESVSAYVASGIARVKVFSPSDPRTWVESEAGTYVNQAVEDEADKQDNITKLAESGASERHLFVYVDPSNYLAWKTMADGIIPPHSPLVSEVFTGVWVATVGRDGRVICWKSSHLGQWETLL